MLSTKREKEIREILILACADFDYPILDAQAQKYRDIALELLREIDGVRHILEMLTTELEYQYDTANAPNSTTEQVRLELVKMAREIL